MLTVLAFTSARPTGNMIRNITVSLSSKSNNVCVFFGLTLIFLGKETGLLSTKGLCVSLLADQLCSPVSYIYGYLGNGSICWQFNDAPVDLSLIREFPGTHMIQGGGTFPIMSVISVVYLQNLTSTMFGPYSYKYDGVLA